MTNIEHDIENLIIEAMVSLKRDDLYREPLIGFSSAKDKRYNELKSIIGEWHLNPSELLDDAESVITYFVPFTKDVSNGPKSTEGRSEIWGEAYTIINSYFNDINEIIVKYLTNLGYSATPIKSTHTFDPKDMKSMWSHRSAAAIAGLGEFGANRMLITEKGSSGRFCTVLTSAHLIKDVAPLEDKCLYKIDGSCGLCFEVCPVHALEPNSLNKFACQYVCNSNKKEDKLGADTCGKCISICPVAYIH